MKNFTDLYSSLDQTTKTSDKIKALVKYFSINTSKDVIWAIRYLTGRRPRRIVSPRKLGVWASEWAGIPDWLFEESYDVVGDLAETISLIVPAGGTGSTLPLHHWIENKMLPLRGKEENAQKSGILSAWSELSREQIFVWNKLLTGGFRVGVSQSIVARALAEFSGVEQAVISHRLMGNWEPTLEFYSALISKETKDADVSRPYPFLLAYPLDIDPEDLGDINCWQAEWKWDGIRAQIIKRSDQIFIWSRGEELITDSFPELKALAGRLQNGTVIDGEIVPWKEKHPLDFSQLQRRLGRKTIGRKLLEEVPVVLIAYDLLEWKGKDIRKQPLFERGRLLDILVSKTNAPQLRRSPGIEMHSWQELALKREQARESRTEGLMIKRKNSEYQVGRKRGTWWKWKIKPFSVDAVLIYAQRGHGRRASLYTDYTFALWNKDLELVPFAKAYSGLTDQEIRKVDQYIKSHTLERFGPVRSVKPELVFEISFENIRTSKRHKSGIAVRFPRISRWRTDKKSSDADTLETVKMLIPEQT